MSRERAQKSGFFVAGDNFWAPPFSPRRLAAALFSRRVEVNKGFFRVNPECRGLRGGGEWVGGGATGEVSSLVLPDELLAHFTLHRGSASDPSNGK